MAKPECDPLKEEINWRPIHNTLTVLIKRKIPKVTSWYNNSIDASGFQCYFCDFIIKYNPFGPNLELRNHGLKHLKEHKLLPFL